MNQQSECFYEFEGFRLDVNQQLLMQGKQTIILKPKLFELLFLFVQNSGRLLTKEQLMQEIWQGCFVEAHNLAVSVYELRQILEGNGKERAYIKTIPRRGYQFVPEVKKTRAEIKRSVNESDNDASIKAAGEDKSFSISTVVLPFKVIGSRVSDEYLGIGISNTLTSKLGGIGSVIICPSSLAAKYAGRDYDLQAIGKKLKADWVIEGAIRKIDKRIRINVQLVRVKDGVLLWSGKFDDKFINILEIEDAISEQVAQALLVNLGGTYKSVSAKRHTENTHAYQLYLRGRHCLDKRTVVELKKANKYFRQAAELDPDYALAYAGIADSYNLLCSYGYFSLEESVEKIRVAAIKALEINPDLAEPHAALGHLKVFRLREFAEGEEELKLAIKLNPNYTNARLWYGIYLRFARRFEESIRELRRALELDPLSLNINNAIGAHFYFTRQYDAAISHLQEVIKFDANHAGTHFYLGQSYERKDLYNEAIKHFQRSIDLADSSNPESYGYLGYTYAKAGQRAKALEMLNRLKNSFNHETMQSALIGVVYLGLGETESAIEWMQKAYQDQSITLIALHIDPKIDVLLQDERIKSLFASNSF